MNKNQDIEKKQQDACSKPSESSATETVTGPYLKWSFKVNEETGESECDTIHLSDKSEVNAQSLKSALKRTVGTSNIAQGELIIDKLSQGMSSSKQELRLNDICALLPALGPKDETEAMLLGQFLALQDSGMKCLRLANMPEQGSHHVERLLTLGMKLLNTSNQTMQTVLKYRSGGHQTVQVVHVHNEGQAIVAQNLSSNRPGEGAQKKNEN